MHPINATKQSNHLRLQALDNKEVIQRLQPLTIG